METRIVFLDRDSVPSAMPRPCFSHVWQDHGQTSPEQVVERLQGARIAVVNKVKLPAPALDQLPDLAMVAIAATGSDNVDLEACRRRGIVVSNVRGYAVHTVPEHAMALLLSLRRNLMAYRADIGNRRWQQSPHFCFTDHAIHDLAGSVLGVVGGGSLGQGLAKLADAFGMKVVFAEHKGAKTVRAERVAFDEVLASADVISLHCPLTSETNKLIAAPELAAMKPGAILLNTARGALVDEAALAQALRSGRIAAGLDVLSKEPPDDDNPLLAPDLLNLPNFLLTPHIGWASAEAVAELARQVVDNIEAFVAGRPANRLA